MEIKKKEGGKEAKKKWREEGRTNKKERKKGEKSKKGKIEGEMV